MNLLSNRSQKFFNSTSFLQKYASQLPGMKAYSKDNKDGFIDFGVSENRLMIDILIDKFSKEVAWLPEYQYYFNSQGILPIREQLAEFFQERFVKNNSKVKIQTKYLCVCNGASSCFTLLRYLI
jgi:aspartate/methionine/tyrosine aminotransferase